MNGQPDQQGRQAGPVIVYDGECPLCASYVRMARLSESAGKVVLVDARGSHPVIDEARASGLDLDAGMVVKMDGQLHYGSDAMVLLTAITTRSGTFNRAMRLLFASPRRARLIYPLLVRGRLMLLRILGRKPIADSR